MQGGLNQGQRQNIIKTELILYYTVYIVYGS